ncbi:glycosyltransferase involved in cell wall biosynthesis [Paraburkholderia eburnea]|uniref:Glycosyltransferase involved in cell wall biosynthesis n=1 Tax=Paraburkholderia eburnea TaxID=1189126 RepID=A0A2S4LTP5_9BURK|nr:glycosyltransferase [Paraburkholderia eburnea]POR45808.1 glycosyltransferase involved in cell wall biosynthesis [Paraburkholderia eburnea]PRZ14665.1 glycosyltransferase involved in cell wall biosynthesis [Paraburkholderia eburnea]
MKIALISEHASPLALAGGVDTGGQNIYVAHVARQLQRAGHQVDVFTRRDRALLPPISLMDGIRVVHVPAGPPTQLPKEKLLPHMGEFASFVVDFCSREAQPYDVVHANFFMSGIAGLAAKDALRVPLVMTFHALGRVRRLHQGASDGFPDERFAIEDEIVRRADCVIAECPADESDLIEHYRAEPKRIAVVACGFDPEEFAPVERREARRHVGWPRDEFAVLQLGRLVRRKGIDNVVQSIAALQAGYGVKARLYIVGGDADTPNELATPEIARLRGVAHRYGIEDRVVFVGRRERAALRYYYSAADVFVTTPWYEPFGITPLEAMACATPVIGADVGGIRHSVRHGETGWLVPARDPHALAARLHALYADPEQARAMGKAGRARAEAYFTWRRIGLELEEIYARLVGSRAAPSSRRRADADSESAAAQSLRVVGSM